MQAAAQHQSHRVGWASVAAAVSIAAIAGASLYMATQYIRSNHERTMRLRMAKAKYRQLVAELSECKGILNYIDSEEMVQAQAVATEAQEIMARADGELADEELARVESIHRQLMLTGEELVRLMEKIDGVAPALVLDAAQLEPWAEHDAELKSKYERRGLGAAFELAGDVRAIRKGMIRKAERRAQIIDRLKRATLRLVENSKPKSLVPDAP